MEIIRYKKRAKKFFLVILTVIVPDAKCCVIDSGMDSGSVRITGVQAIIRIKLSVKNVDCIKNGLAIYT